MRVDGDDFYVGYLSAPPSARKTMSRVAAALLAIGAAAAAILLASQNPFANATFEYGVNRDFRGTMIAQPAPALMIQGQGLPWLLVAPGKHGFEDMDALDGHEVRLKGERIERGADHMIEVQPDSLVDLGTQAVMTAPVGLGHVTLTGEIVDSKCYFGVMNPGNGKVHRDCAARCISGGIPPAFLVRDKDGNANVMLLANWNRDRILAHIAEPITLSGRLTRSSGRLILMLE
jgi:hypothetical protein